MKKYFFFFLMILFIGLWMWASKSYSEKKIELKFSHKFHIEENEIECQVCHAMAEESVKGTDNLMPTMEICGECHDVEDEEGCKICHSNMDEPRAVPRVEDYSQLFSHKKHFAAKLDCQTCHSEVANKEIASPYILPGMTNCMDCHGKKKTFNLCETCHLPSENLKPLSHNVNFIHTHSDLAKNDAAEISGNMKCVTCHQTNFCQDCHEGNNLDRKTHPLNYQFTHSLQAQGKERECATCHTERQFCIDCHRDNQVLPHNHVAGWALQNVGGRHKDEALNDIESCMACHEQNAEQICQKCHGK